MMLEHHKFTHEFPELKQYIHELEVINTEFAKLMKEYDETDDEIYRIEHDIETPSDFYTEALKMNRVELKDRLYAAVKSYMESH